MRDFFLILINFFPILGPRRESKSHFRTRQIFERFHGRWWGLDGALWPLYLGTRLCQGRILLWRTYFATSTQSFVLSTVRSKLYTVVCKIVHKIASVWCKTALGEVGVSLSWWCAALVLLTPGYWSLFLNLKNLFIMEKWPQVIFP